MKIINDNKEYYRKTYLSSEHWLHLKYKKLTQCNICSKCGSNNNLDVHHINYKHLYDVKLNDLMVLCRSCHHKTHKCINKNIKLQNNEKNIKKTRRNRRNLIKRVSKILNIDKSIIRNYTNNFMHQ